MAKNFNTQNLITRGAGPKVLVITVPKSGTNLVGSTLEQFTGMSRCRGLATNERMRHHPLNYLPFTGRGTCLMGIKRTHRVKLAAARFSLSRLKPWQYGAGHIPYQSNIRTLIDEYGIRPVLVIRDPRDVLFSTIHYSVNRKRHWLARTMQALGSQRDQIKAMILGGVTETGFRYNGIAEQLDLIEGWLADRDVMTIRFEKIIGSKGSGTKEEQLDTIMRLGDFIGLPVNEDEARRIGDAMFGKGRTFRKGMIGGWKEVFDDELTALFQDKVGDRLSRFGYA